MPDTPPKNAAEARERAKAHTAAISARKEARLWEVAMDEFEEQEGRPPNWAYNSDTLKVVKLYEAHANPGTATPPTDPAPPEPSDSTGSKDEPKDEPPPDDDPVDDPDEAITVVLKRSLGEGADSALVDVLAGFGSTLNRVDRSIGEVAKKQVADSHDLDYLFKYSEWAAKLPGFRGKPPLPAKK